jgi:hypothetical protein
MVANDKRKMIPIPDKGTISTNIEKGDNNNVSKLTNRHLGKPGEVSRLLTRGSA